MLFTPFSSPRRLALLAVLVLCCTLVLFRKSDYRDKISSYTFTGARPIEQHLDTPKEQTKPPEKQRPFGEDPIADKVANGRQKHQHPSVDVTPFQVPKPVNYSDGPITPVKHLTFPDLQKSIVDLKDWETLNTENHWPSWDAYKNSDYDPNRWEGFDWWVASCPYVRLVAALTSEPQGARLFYQERDQASRGKGCQAGAIPALSGLQFSRVAGPMERRLVTL